MKVECYFNVSADDPDLVQHVLDMLTTGAKVFGKKRVIVGTPKGEVPLDSVIIAPLNIQVVPS